MGERGEERDQKNSTLLYPNIIRGEGEVLNASWDFPAVYAYNSITEGWPSTSFLQKESLKLNLNV